MKHSIKKDYLNLTLAEVYKVLKQYNVPTNEAKKEMEEAKEYKYVSPMFQVSNINIVLIINWSKKRKYNIFVRG